MTRRVLTPALTFLLLVLAAPMVTRSCANTSTPPSGGPKDTIPPVLLACEPVYNAINCPVDPKSSAISFIFDEYVQVKDANQNIFLSPPQVKKPQWKMKGKALIIYFKEPLDSNTTYSLDLGNAVSDNNEGNPFPKFVYSFSTGSIIDSLFVSGTVSNAASLLQEKGITVLFHKDLSDSALFNKLPDAAAKTDDWGYFTVRNLKNIPYRVYAIKDENGNNKYDPETDMIAFLDTILVPDRVMVLDMPELAVTDIKDTLLCLSRPSQLQLALFREVQSRQYLKSRGRPQKRMFYLSFRAPYVQLDSLRVAGLPPEKMIVEKNIMQDSLTVWINDGGFDKDTITVTYKYMMTDDSLNIPVPKRDTLRLPPPKPKLTKDRRGNAVEVKDTVAAFTMTATPENVEQDGFILEFKTPLTAAPFDSIRLKCVNTRQQVSWEKVSVEPDSVTTRKYVLRMTKKIQPGYDYTLKFPHRLFKDIYGLPCDSLDTRITLPNSEELSSITLDIHNVHTEYIVELISEKRDRVFRSFRIKEDSKLLFPYLREGQYSVRITEDKNGNGLLDTGSLLDHLQPEKVLLFRFSKAPGNDAFILKLPKRMDMEQTVDLEEMFR